MATCRKTEAEVRRLAETVARRHQYASFGESQAEIASVDAVCQPRKCDHPATGPHPVQQTLVLREKLIEQDKVVRRHLAGATVNLVAVLQSYHSKPLPEHISGDGEVVARIVITLATPRIVIDHPADT